MLEAVEELKGYRQLIVQKRAKSMTSRTAQRKLASRATPVSKSCEVVRTVEE